MNVLVKKFVVIPLVIGMAAQLAACGTILYPERKGQGAGRLDPGVVVLDAVGLLFFVIPGVIAFAVDFNNGSIYLPGGSASLDTGNINVVAVEGGMTNEKIEQIVLKETGESIHLNDDNVSVREEKAAFNTIQSAVRFL